MQKVPPPQFGGVFDTLQAGGNLGPFIMAKISVRRPGGELLRPRQTVLQHRQRIGHTHQIELVDALDDRLGGLVHSFGAQKATVWRR